MIRYLTIGVPPVGNRVTCQFTSMVGGANLDVAHIVPDIVQSVRNSNSSTKGGQSWSNTSMVSWVYSCPSRYHCPINSFFGVHTHDRIAWALIRLLELVNGLKLLIAMFTLSCCQCLHCFGFRRVVFLQQLV
jgi:hypothetical protein